MNMPMALNGPTMSSREIAEVVESRHDTVKRTMETLKTRGLISITQTEEPQARGGKPVTVYHVNAGGRWCKNLDAGERSECMANKHGTARDEPPPGRACSITAKPRHLHAKQRG
tara:strand:- start:9404 stop:9745 length:342 start_codon:yes stop_codon:yes gene_type:complete